MGAQLRSCCKFLRLDTIAAAAAAAGAIAVPTAGAAVASGIAATVATAMPDAGAAALLTVRWLDASRHMIGMGAVAADVKCPACCCVCCHLGCEVARGAYACTALRCYWAPSLFCPELACNVSVAGHS